MNRTFPAFTLLLVLVSNLQANPMSPRKRRIDVHQLSLNLRFDLTRQFVEGTATIHFSPLFDTKEVYLDAAYLDVKQVKTLDRKQLRFTNGANEKDDALKIEFDSILKTGEEISIQIDYKTLSKNLSDPKNLSGSFGKGIRFLQPSSSEPRRRWQAWSIGQPGSNRYWYPCYDAPNDQFVFEMKALVDNRFLAISNGTLIQKKLEADGLTSFHWKLDQPISNHQVSIVVGDYVNLKDTLNDLNIYNYSYPDEVEATVASTERLKDMIKYLSTLTDTKFPYASYSQVFVQDIPWGGGHHAAVSTITENMIDDYGTHSDFLYLWDGIEGNDLAAQWFGNLLTPYDWEHVWLNKSFANYFSMLYNEYKNGTDEVQLWVRAFNLSTIIGDWTNNYRRPLVVLDSIDPTTTVNDNYSTVYGAEVLHMLRKQVGEENWIKIIRQYVKQYSGKLVTTDNFFNVVEEATGQSMHWFFDQWIYKMGHPVFEVKKEYSTDRKELKLFIKQVQTQDTTSQYPQAKFFQGNLEVEIDGKISTFWIPARKESEFTVAQSTRPEFVNIDFGRQWIKEISYDQTIDELFAQASKSTDIMARNEAIGSLTTLFLQDSMSVNQKKSTLHLFQQISTENAYWRIRSVALASWRTLANGQIDPTTESILRSIIKKDSSWLRATAIGFLGDSKKQQYFPLYQHYLNDKSDRVVNTAAVAIGKSKHPKAFATLSKLRSKPSWKNQSLISCLNGLFQLGDQAGIEIALKALKDDPPQPRWTLANTTWDYRFTAVSTLAKLGKVDQAHNIIVARLVKSLEENSILDIFNNVQLMSMLGDPRGQAQFDLLKQKYADNSEFLEVVTKFESDYKKNLTAKK